MADVVYELLAKIGLDRREFDDGLNESGSRLKDFGGKIKTGLATAAKVTAAATAAVGAAVVSLTKQSIESYAEYEQLVGGVQTLFGAQGMSLEEYAESVGKTVGEVKAEYDSLISAETTVMNNAADAFKTAGMSANEYMETVTSFSASLIQSLGGDTEAAAKYADMAIVDMSDNANKMGSSMESIQNAYQGFAKQNYTMLDNLKLGYGGTKSEMERLVEDAEKLDSSFRAQRDETGALTLSYADVVDAIHIVQTEMGITGTTAREASTTIQGSLGSMKSAWANLVTGFADGNADIGKLVDDLIETIIGKDGEGGVLNNILPAVERAMDGIVKFIGEAAPKLIPMAVDIIIQNLPMIVEAGTNVLVALISGLIVAIPQLVAAIPDILSAIWETLKDNWPQMKQAGIDLLLMLKNGFVEKAGELLTAVKEKFESIRLAIKGKIDLIKGLFNFQWSFPHLKLPHITYSLIDVPILGTIPDPRTLSVQWYKKAYDNPYVFDRPTVMGFGDGAGGEMVYGHQNLMKDIKTAVTDVVGNLSGESTIVVQAVLDGKIVSETVTKYQRQMARANG